MQYGFEALNAGTITVDQFLDLNEDDRRLRHQRPDRRRARGAPTAGRDPARVRDGPGPRPAGATIRDIPIITVNLYSDPYGDIHDRFRLFTIRERLRTDDGKVNPNEMIWTRPSGGDIAAALTGTAFDPADVGRAPRHAGSRSGTGPTEAVDNCTDADGTMISGSKIYDEPGTVSRPVPGVRRPAHRRRRAD